MKLLKILLLPILGLSLFFILFYDNKKELEKPQKVKIAVYNGSTSSLIILTKKLGFFKKQNLDVELINAKSGKRAMDILLEGKANFSTQTDFVTVKNSFSNDKFKILASVAEGDVNSMLAFKSSGIHEASDIKNKRVGTTIGTATEFYTGIFLEQNNMNLEDIKLINVPVTKRYEVIKNRSVDALFSWEPYIYKLKKMYKDELTYFPMPVGFQFYFTFIVDSTFHKENPKTSQKVLSAIREFEIYKDANPEEFEKLIQKEFELENDYLKYIIKKHNFELSLPYSLSILMDKQAKWLIQNNLVENKKFNLNKIIDKSILEEVNKESITLID